MKSIHHPCKYCNSPTKESDSKSTIGLLIGCGMTYEASVAELPICSHCVESRHVGPSRRKFHTNPDVNSTCLWVQHRKISADDISIEEHERFYVIKIGKSFQKFLKDAEPIPRGILFSRLDNLLACKR